RRNIGITIIWPGSQKMPGTKTGLFTGTHQRAAADEGVPLQRERAPDRGAYQGKNIRSMFFVLINQHFLFKN
uniref:hypothetical protein n=1 Tax=Salmonella enterica TaxID=28901 RepID=UPI001C378833